MEPRSSWQDAPSEPWRIIAERKLNEAIAQGFFDNLPGTGRPLNLSDNPFEPAEERLSNSILKNAGFVPPWAELGRQIDRARDRVDAERDRLLAIAQRHSRRNSLTNPPSSGHADSDDSGLAMRVSDFLQAITDLNRAIDDFNLAVPVLTLQQPRLSAMDEMKRLRDAGFSLDRRSFPT